MIKKTLIKFQCQDCKRINYLFYKSKGKAAVKGEKEKKLEFKKYCKWCRKHTAHKEGKR